MPKDPNSPEFDREIFSALIWNDPDEYCGYRGNCRGAGVFSFGPDITESFLKRHNLSLLIRSHQYQVFGYRYDHSGKCLTVFSSPNYE